MRGRFAVSLIVVAFAATACIGPGRDDGSSSPASPTPAGAGEPEAPDDDLRVPTRGWETDFSQHEVPLSEFISGGPGKDGIPSIDSPRFQPVDEVDWLEDVEPVIAFGIEDEWRAYPIQILMWHEIVNDEVGGVPVAVTFCPLCHTAIVFDREFDGRLLDFGTTGNLRHSDLVMYDRQTESWWQQATGRALVGELTGSALTFLPSQLISWDRFRSQHPEGQVLSRQTGHNRPYGSNPYVGYDSLDSTPFLLDDRTLIDGRLSPKVRVVGLVIDEEPVAYPFPFLAEEQVVNDEVGGTPVVISWVSGTASGMGAETVAGGTDVGAANAFGRVVDDQTLTFEPAGEEQMRDLETGTTWSFEGRAVAGELEGAELELLVSDSPFWFAWAIFQPETRVWEP
jgi:hypothetical protein